MPREGHDPASEANASAAFVVVQFRDGVGIDRIFVNRIAAVTVTDGKTRIARGDFLNHKLKSV